MVQKIINQLSKVRIVVLKKRLLAGFEEVSCWVLSVFAEGPRARLSLLPAADSQQENKDLSPTNCEMIHSAYKVHTA